MIPYRVHIAIIGATIMLIVVFLFTLFTPLPAGAAPRCREGRVETVVEGMTRQCVHGRWVLGPTTGRPSRQAVRR